YFSQRPAAMVVGQRLTLAAGVNKLLAMQGVAMHEIVQRAGPADGDPRDSKKIPLHVQGFPVRSEIKPAADQDSTQANAEANRSVNKDKTRDGRQTQNNGVPHVDRLQLK